MLNVFYSPSYVCAEHSFDTTRKAGWIAQSLSDAPLSGVVLQEPQLLTREQLGSVHDLNYVEAVATGMPRDLAESQGFRWDAGMWSMVRATNGGLVAAANAARRDGAAGTLSSGLHHARRGHGAGFCTFNGLAIAAKLALTSGATSVLILDLDAHCGGGTQSLIADDPRIWQLDVSVSSFDSYRGTPHHRLELVQSAAAYLPTIRRGLKWLEDVAPSFDLCLYNAGMDPCEDCALGGLQGITHEMIAEREWLVFDWCRQRKLPVAFALAGGYLGSRLDEDGLVSLHRLTLVAAARRQHLTSTVEA